MAKPKGNKKSLAAGKASRRPRQKGKIKNRPETDYLAQIAEMSREIGRVEREKMSEMIAQGCSETIARNIAKRAAWEKRNELIACR